VASFVIRLLSLGKSGILFKEALSGLEAKAPNFAKWAAVLQKTPNIIDIFDENIWTTKISERISAARA
jgi:Co/Zn/Cd efflux system component